MSAKQLRESLEEKDNALKAHVEAALKVVQRMDDKVSSGDAVDGEDVEQIRKELESLQSGIATDKAAALLAELDKGDKSAKG